MTGIDPHDVRIRKREIVLSSADQLAYAEVLAREFPEARFLDDPYTLPKNEKPSEATVRSLAECRCENVVIVFDPAWRPEWKGEPNSPKSNCWYIRNLPLPNGRFERGRGIRQKKRPDDTFAGEISEGIESGRIYFRIAPNDREQEMLARKALRLIGKIASNKGLLLVRYPSQAVICPETRSEWWIGFDARRWCLEKPTRSLGGMWHPSGAWAYRPKAEGLTAPPAQLPGTREAEAPSGSGSRIPSRRVSERWRAWIMTWDDELAYADLLAQAFPGVRFIEDYVPVATTGPMPDIRPRAALAECPADTVHIVLDPTWKFKWRYEKYEIDGPYARWIYGELPLPYGTIKRNPFGGGEGGPRTRPLNTDQASKLTEGRIYFYSERGNESQRAAVSTALRLIGRVASRKNFVRVDAKTLNVIDSDPGAVPWIGNGARRWCLEKPDRIFGGIYIDPWSEGWRLRPKAE